MQELCDAGYDVLLETSGAVAIDKVDRRVKAIDVKTPNSGESERFIEKNLALLWPDASSFVLCSKDDYTWAKNWLQSHPLPKGIPVLFSPEAEKLPPQHLAEWIMADKLSSGFKSKCIKSLGR